jgi:hypothetical protein
MQDSQRGWVGLKVYMPDAIIAEIRALKTKSEKVSERG